MSSFLPPLHLGVNSKSRFNTAKATQRSISSPSLPLQLNLSNVLILTSTYLTTMSGEHFGTTDADVILRSADGQEFHVHKSMLSIASPVFRDMFTLPQPPSPGPSSIPVVDMCELGNVLDLFLRCLYPVSKPVIEDFGLLEALLTAAEKYEAGVVLDVVKSWLAIPENLGRDPLRAYAIACTSAAFDEQAKFAAKSMTFNTINSAHPETIARLTTMDHHRLVVYLVNREKEASRVISEPSWTIFYTPRCACDSEAKTKLREAIKKALLDGFVENPSLTTEGASVLALKQLAKVHPCDHNQNCSLVTQGEEYAGELVKKLRQMSDGLLW